MHFHFINRFVRVSEYVAEFCKLVVAICDAFYRSNMLFY